ncbi:hypothetical protein BJX64DRAFT_205569 [Aspergillus heterothallicus]
MERLQGRWIINKTLSTGTEGILKLQGVPWALRKAVSLVTITLDVAIYPKTTTTSAETDPASTTKPPTIIDLQITATGGLPGAKELRVLDWSEQDQSDFAFGTTKHRTGLVKGNPDAAGNWYPDIEMKNDPGSDEARRFLRGEILEDGSPSTWLVRSTDPEEEAWVHTLIRSVPEKWTVEQVWGFEEIDGQLYHARRFVAVNLKGEYALGRALYKRADDCSGANN